MPIAIGITSSPAAAPPSICSATSVPVSGGCLSELRPFMLAPVTTASLTYVSAPLETIVQGVQHPHRTEF
jgi:hypothetical protein